MVIDDWQKKYIESGLFSYDCLKDSDLPGDRMIVRAIDKAEAFFESQKTGGDLQVEFIRRFYKKYSQHKNKMKKGMFHNIVCQDLGIEQAAGYVVRNEIVLRVALVAATEGLIRFD